MRDFDAFWAEKRGLGPQCRAFGLDLQLPRSIPFAFMAHMAAKAEQAEKVGGFGPESFDFLTETGMALFGADQFAAMCRAGMGLEELVELMDWVYAAYQGADDNDAPKAEESPSGEA